MYYNGLLKRVNQVPISFSIGEFTQYWHYTEERTRLAVCSMQLLGVLAWLIAAFNSVNPSLISGLNIASFTIGLLASIFLTVLRVNLGLRLFGKFSYVILLAHKYCNNYNGWNDSTKCSSCRRGCIRLNCTC